MSLFSCGIYYSKNNNLNGRGQLKLQFIEKYKLLPKIRMVLNFKVYINSIFY